MKKILLFLSLLFIPLLSQAVDYEVSTVPNVQITNKLEYVTNPDAILSQRTVSLLNIELDSLRSKYTVEIVVVAVNSIGNYEIKQFANELFAAWGIGAKDKDNGLLILFVENQHKVTFETGYGMEGIFPDAICKRIQMQAMIPYFKSGDYDKGMIAGVENIAQILADPALAQEVKSTIPLGVQKSNITKWLIWYLIFSIVISFIFLYSVKNALHNTSDKTHYAQYLSLSKLKYTLAFCGIIFPLFSLFIFFWVLIKLHYLRHTPRICPTCKSKMRRLGEKADDAYLSSGELLEEQINSVDYDVWLCDKCHTTQIFPYELYSKYSICPECGRRAYTMEYNRILMSPTQFSAGTGEKGYHCSHCKRIDKQQYTIPIIILPPISRGGGGGGFSGGGGGFSGGGFGGGSSGGGGATSGW